MKSRILTRLDETRRKDFSLEESLVATLAFTFSFISYHHGCINWYSHVENLPSQDSV